MDSGSPLLAKAISMSRSIMYCSTGAMFGYGALAACARVCHAVPSAQKNTKPLSAIALKVFLFIPFSQQRPLSSKNPQQHTATQCVEQQAHPCFPVSAPHAPAKSL